jgi:hypothetical protein
MSLWFCFMTASVGENFIAAFGAPACKEAALACVFNLTLTMIFHNILISNYSSTYFFISIFKFLQIMTQVE